MEERMHPMQRDPLWIGLGGFAAGFGVGTLVMYLLDPDRGNRRRALVRDQLVHAGNVTTHRVRTTAADLRNRSRGVGATVGSRLKKDDGISDQKLEARVRSEMGHAISNPSAISVSAEDHAITLAGPVLRDELDHLLSAVGRVRGVREVRNRLQVAEAAGEASDN
jgi:hypothetical protein